ncbi:MAG: protein kinase [Deltaproteobacteria bacterium]|nr:protein kinase [Deltaproteobacteria bacterium]
MRCATCGRDNREGRMFCSDCGALLALRCPQCQAFNESGEKFCGECGASLGAGTPTAIGSAPPPQTTNNLTTNNLPAAFASGRYRVQRLLGEGARKRVYLARDHRLDRDVALGLIKTEGLDDAGRARVQREAQAMARLGDHPHIVTVFDIGEEDGQAYIVSQYMAGGSVDDLLRESVGGRQRAVGSEESVAAHSRAPLSITDALRIAQQICLALDHAHARGVIHRDLKPGNVWLAADGSAKLGDFGLALDIDQTRLTQMGTMVGTAAYMAPEQALSGEVTASVDLYALGALLYELLTGRPPFLGDDVVAVISQHINTPPVAPSWHNPAITRELEALTLQLLAKSPAQRPASAAIVGERLAQIANAPSAVAGVIPASSPAVNPLDRLASGIFVGRDKETQQLRAAFDDALSGRGRILLLVGEPGIGKTRTAEELATYAQMRGAQVLWGRCHEGEGAPAYWPWVNAIRAYVHTREPKLLAAEMGPGAADIAEVVSEVRDRLPGLPVAPRLEPEQARFRLFESVTTFLRNASRAKPLVVVLDDLHWADKPSLLLLEFLAREIGDARLLLMGTYRDVELGRQHPLEQTLAELVRNQRGERVLLRGLSGDDVARFIELTAGRTPPPALVEAVYRETEGNPFFITEVVRLLQSDGRLDRADTVASWSVEIPQGVRQVIGRRLSTLSERCNQVLTIAAVLGREFELRVLPGVSELSVDAVAEALDEAEAARIIAPLPPVAGRYRFSHALIRETLYGELRTAQRIRSHRRAAEVLEALYGTKPEPHLAELAHHFCEAAPGGDVGKAVDYAVRAAERASALLAFEEAANHYERALQTLEVGTTVDGRRRCEILLALATAEICSGSVPKADEADRRALALARELDDAELFARAALGLAINVGTPFSMSAIDERSQALNEAMERLGDAPTLLRVRILYALTVVRGWVETNDDRDARLWHAIDLARSIDDPESLRVAIHLQASVFFLGLSVRSDERRGLLTESLRLAVETGDREQEFRTRTNILRECIRSGDGEGVDRELVHLQRLAVELRQRDFVRIVDQTLADRALWRGHLDEAERCIQAALGRREHAPEAAFQVFVTQVGALRRFQGRLTEVERGTRRGRDLYPNVEGYSIHLACYLAELARDAEARAEFDRIAQAGFATLRDSNYLMNLALLADTCTLLRDSECAKELYRTLLPYEQLYLHFAHATTYGAATRALGNLAGVMRYYEGAARHFEDALAMDRRLGARAWEARTQIDYARMRLDRDGPGDREQARVLLGAALATSQELGLKGWLDMALALKLRAQGVESGTMTTSIEVVAADVQRHRPDLRSVAASDGSVTLMFSDIEGSTVINERLGDRKWLDVLRAHNAIVREHVAAHNGVEVKSQGDGFMIVFQSARRALHCAIAMQRGFTAYNQRHADEPLRVRIGLHAGEVIREADDFFGKNVVLAARIAGTAQGGEILVSAALQAATGDTAARFGAPREVALKGITEPQRIHAVAWDAD